MPPARHSPFSTWTGTSVIFSENSSPSFLCNTPEGRDGPSRKGHFCQCLQSALYFSTAIQNKRNCLQILNKTIWTQNKAFNLGMAQDAKCLRCDETETTEHLLYDCGNCSAKILNIAGVPLTLAISRHSGKYMTSTCWRLYTINHPSILLHIRDGTTWSVLILLLQEVKGDIIFFPPCSTNNAEATRRTSTSDFSAPALRPQKICALPEHQGGLHYNDALVSYGTWHTPFSMTKLLHTPQTIWLILMHHAPLLSSLMTPPLCCDYPQKFFW